MNITFTAYDEASHLDQLASLQQHLWEGQTDEQLKKIFRWKYPKDAPLKNGFVAMDGGRLVAFRGFFINDYTDGNVVFPVAVFADAVTHPDYRGQGLFSKLTTFGYEYYQKHKMGCILALSSGNNSSQGYIKLGWIPFARKTIGLRPLPMAFLPGREAATRCFVRRMGRKGVEVSRPEIITPELAAELAEHFRATRGRQVGLLRDEKFWLHRYSAPHLDYKLIVLRKKEAIVGFVSYCIARSKGIKHIKIIDISPDPKQMKALIKAVGLYSGCSLMLIYLSCPDVSLSRKTASLFPVKRKEKGNDPANFIIIKTLTAAAGLPDMLDGENWSLGYVDSDSM